MLFSLPLWRGDLVAPLLPSFVVEVRDCRCVFSRDQLRLSQQDVVGFSSKTDESLCCQLWLSVHYG